MKKKQVVILGVFSPIGQALISCLAEQGFESEQVQLLDAEANTDMIMPYGNDMLVVQDLTTFDFKYCAIVFLCTPAILSTHLDVILEKIPYLIDCTGIIGTEPCIIPSLNLKALKKQETNIITNPTSLSITLAQVLSPIHQKFSVQYAQDTAMISVSEFGTDATNALIEQTRSLYTREAPTKGPFQKIQAFNLIPEPYPMLSRQTTAQLKILLHFLCFLLPFQIYFLQILHCFLSFLRILYLHLLSQIFLLIR
jgi:aspartate-semialdehyde dehydrogenase